MIKDVKSYFNAVTSRLSNAFNIQDFDLEEEAQFWALAAEHLSRKKPPTFRDMASWVDLLFKAPVHLVYKLEGEQLILFRQHIISENMEYLYEMIDDDIDSSKNRQQIVRDFEDRLANVEPKIRYREEFKMMGTTSFTIGRCQYIPLFDEDEFWGMYCVGPYVEAPEAIVPRLSIITRILTTWLNERYEKQHKLQYQKQSKPERKDEDRDVTPGLNTENTARFLLSYLAGILSAEAGVIVREKDDRMLLEQVNVPEAILGKIKGYSGAKDSIGFEEWIDKNHELFEDHSFINTEKIEITGDSSVSVYLFYTGVQQNKFQRNDVLSKQLLTSFRYLLRIKDENKQFVDQLLQTYYLMLRKLEQNKKRTDHHTPRVIAYCRRFANLFGLNEEEKKLLLKTARFHDIGYIAFESTSIDAELQHPVTGKKIMQDLMVEPEVFMGVATHHEWIDGSGTPGGLKSEEIPWTGKVVAIFEFIVQFVESNLKNSVENQEKWKDELVQTLVRRTGKQFDMILMPTAIELIKSMTWQECSNLGVDQDEI